MSEQPFWREQYALVISTLNGESDRFWKRFEIYLAVNSGLFAVISAISNFGDLNTDNFSLAGISLIGIVLSVFWAITIWISRTLQARYSIMGRKIESEHKTEMNGVEICEKYTNKITVTKVSLCVPFLFIIVWEIFLAIHCGIIK